jgi:hypothetical protein
MLGSDHLIGATEAEMRALRGDTMSMIYGRQ